MWRKMRFHTLKLSENELYYRARIDHNLLPQILRTMEIMLYVFVTNAASRVTTTNKDRHLNGVIFPSLIYECLCLLGIRPFHLGTSWSGAGSGTTGLADTVCCTARTWSTRLRAPSPTIAMHSQRGYVAYYAARAWCSLTVHGAHLLVLLYKTTLYSHSGYRLFFSHIPCTSSQPYYFLISLLQLLHYTRLLLGLSAFAFHIQPGPFIYKTKLHNFFWFIWLPALEPLASAGMTSRRWIANFSDSTAFDSSQFQFKNSHSQQPQTKNFPRSPASIQIISMVINHKSAKFHGHQQRRI